MNFKLLIAGMLASLPLLPLTSASAASDAPIKIAFVVTTEANLIDIAGPWEVFNEVHVPSRGATMDEQMPYITFIVSDSKKPLHIGAMKGAGVTVVPQYTFENAPTPDLIVVGAQHAGPAVNVWLRKQHENGKTIMSVCTGAFILGRAGLLDGLHATTHHAAISDFRKSFPKVTVDPGNRYIESSPILFTAGGLTSRIDLALHMVDRALGRDVATVTADTLEYSGTGWISPKGASPLPTDE